MRSSYDKRMVLTQLIERGSLEREREAKRPGRGRRHAVGLRSPPGADGLRRALRRRAGGARAVLRRRAAAIKSNYERRQVLTQVARKGKVAPRRAASGVRARRARCRRTTIAPKCCWRSSAPAHRRGEPAGVRVGRRAHQVVARSESRARGAGEVRDGANQGRETSPSAPTRREAADRSQWAVPIIGRLRYLEARPRLGRRRARRARAPPRLSARTRACGSVSSRSPSAAGA